MGLLAAALAVLTAAVGFVSVSGNARQSACYALQLDARARMERCMEAVRGYREELGLPLSPGDFHKTGLIGEEYTDITTTLGSIEAKRTAADPDMAALLVRMFSEAGLRSGDRVGAGFSGSFPSLNLAVLCACDGLNYMTTPEDLRQALGSVCRVLRPGGLFLFDVSTREKLQAMDGEFYGEEEENVAYLWENRFDQASQCLTMDITFFFQVDAARDLFRRQRELHVQRGHSREELEAALTAAGFAVQTVEEAFTRHSPAPGCQRIQITARKR